MRQTHASVKSKLDVALTSALGVGCNAAITLSRFTHDLLAETSDSEVIASRAISNYS
jgi:hypothetical protein